MIMGYIYFFCIGSGEMVKWWRKTLHMAMKLEIAHVT